MTIRIEIPDHVARDFAGKGPKHRQAEQRIKAQVQKKLEDQGWPETVELHQTVTGRIVMPGDRRIAEPPNLRTYKLQ